MVAFAAVPFHGLAVLGGVLGPSSEVGVTVVIPLLVPATTSRWNAARDAKMPNGSPPAEVVVAIASVSDGPRRRAPPTP